MRKDRPMDYTRLWGSSYNNFLRAAIKRLFSYFSLADVPSVDAPHQYSYEKALSYYADNFFIKPVMVGDQLHRLYMRTPTLARHKSTNKPVLLMPILGYDFQIIDDEDQIQAVISINEISKNFDTLIQLFPLNVHDGNLKWLKTASRLLYPSFLVFIIAVLFALLSLSFFAVSAFMLDVTTTNTLALSLAQITSVIYLSLCLVLASMAASQNYGLFVVFFCHDLFRSLSSYFETENLKKNYAHVDGQAKFIYFDGYKIIFASMLLVTMAVASMLLSPSYMFITVAIDVVFIILSVLLSKRFHSANSKKLIEMNALHETILRVRDILPLGFGLNILDASIKNLQSSHKKSTDSCIDHWYVTKLAHFTYFMLPLIALATLAMMTGGDESMPLWQVIMASIVVMLSSVTAAYIGFKAYEFIYQNRGLMTSEDSYSNARRVKLVRMLGSVELDHISFAYEKTGQVIFKDFSLALNPGKLTIIEGPSGSGKTTLLKIMMGFLSPEVGRVIYDGHDLRSLDMSALRSHCGVIFDQSQVFSGSVYDNIVCGRSLGKDSVRNLLLSSEIFDGLIDMPMGLSTYVVEQGKNISSYEKFLILFARALVHRPPYIFIDDALSALSSDEQKRVMKYLIECEATCAITSPRRIDCGDQDKSNIRAIFSRNF